MQTAPIIFGNSGGGLFLANTGELIGIPSEVRMLPMGWSADIITHMNMFIPIERVYRWFRKEHYDFLYNKTKSEKECLDVRKGEIKEKKESGM